MVDPACHSESLEPRVNPSDRDFAVKIHVPSLMTEVFRRHREDAVQVIALLKPLSNHAIEARAAQVERLAFDRLREAASIKTQRTVQ